MEDRPEKISVEEAKAKAESIVEDVKNWIDDAAEDGMIFAKHFFDKVKNIFKDIDWTKTPDWLDDDDDIDIDSMGT